jgi:lipid-binding SYLF domain-containing protein
MLFACLAVSVLTSAMEVRVAAQIIEEETVRAASAVLSETMALPLNGIPEAMLANAHGVAIIPNVIKGSFIVGARHGRGLLFVREPNGVWHAPVFITLTGGNIGWQVGVQSSDIILVLKTAKSVEGILRGKLTLGADAAAAAGPVGRQGAVATDGKLQAEIYSYSRSRGLFAGVSIDGSVVQMDTLATGAYYRSPAPGQPVIVPQSAQMLTQAIVAYTGSATDSQVQSSALAQQYAASQADIVRGQLVQLAPQLFDLLDVRWRSYLALPTSLSTAGEHASPHDVQETIKHYRAVAADPQFQTLASRAEFQSVFALLQHYEHALSPNTDTLQLPPPPPGDPYAR